MADAARSPRRRQPRPALQVERLEDRCLMDGAGFVHTDPDDDPGSIVGVAHILAGNDYLDAPHDATEVLIGVLDNDPLPEGSAQLRIKSVSATARGATVEISDDGRRIRYTPPAGGVSWDSFYYIVEDEHGQLGKANVTINAKSTQTSYASYDRFTVLEDSGEIRLDVLANDWPNLAGEIVAVTAPSGGGTVRIADDGKAVFYTPAAAYNGYEFFRYSVRDSSGATTEGYVEINVEKPYRIGYEEFRFDVDSGPQTLNVLANDARLGPTPETPRIVAVTQPPLGSIAITDDGQRLLFTPAPGFVGSASLQYTVQYGPAEHQKTTGTVQLTVEHTFLVVDDWFGVAPDSSQQRLDVLRNDPIISRWNVPDVTLRIVEVAAGNRGGAISVDPAGGAILYAPAAGFIGDETFTYTVENSNGHRDVATATVHVAARSADALPRFADPGELEQFLIDQAVARYKAQFGSVFQWYSWNFPGTIDFDLNRHAADFVAAMGHSETNTQEAGVDEGDIVETDGRFLYSFSHGKLAIVDLADPAHPQLVSLTALDGWFDEMYLQGGRLTLIGYGSQWSGDGAKAVIATLDISDSAAPAIVERTEIDGHIVDSRAVGDRVHIAAMGLTLPELQYRELPSEDPASTVKLRQYETLDEYVARVRATLVESSLPLYRTYDGAGQLVRQGLLVAAEDVHKPIDEADDSLLALVTFDVADGVPGPDASAGVVTSPGSHAYMSGSSFYVLRHDGDDTAIFKFALDDDGAPTLPAIGHVDGWLLNQFSVDEHEGRLRVATTGMVEEVFDSWRREIRRSNNLFVLEQVGAELVVVGAVENLAPTETIKSVRFMDDRAYVVTFRVVDPLFAIDLGDPTSPTVMGALKIPGYSDYLHPVGENYVIGIGRDADEITGAVGLPQISLFYVGDLANPALVDQVTMEGAQWAFSEAWNDHHAFAYFAENQLLTMPVSWSETIPIDDDGDGFPDRHEWKSGSAVWAFRVTVDGSGGGAIENAGRVEHDGQARRSVRIGDSLITISDEALKIHDIEDLTHQLGELYLGPLPADDVFTVDEDSGATVIDVRANDRSGVGGAAPHIVGVTQPSLGFWNWADFQTEQEVPGTVEISPDGASLIFTPAADFFGTVTFSYTVRDALHGDETASVTITVAPVADDPRAVDDEFDVEPDSGPITLDVLANDADPDARRTYGGGIIGLPIYAPPLFQVRPMIALATDELVLDRMIDVGDVSLPWIPAPALTITAVSAGSHGGSIAIAADGGTLSYQPAAGFTGVETFTYTVKTSDGRTAIATVAVQVGAATPETPAPETPAEASLLVGAAPEVDASSTTPGPSNLAASLASSSTTMPSAAATPIELPNLSIPSLSRGAERAARPTPGEFRPALRPVSIAATPPAAVAALREGAASWDAETDDALGDLGAVDPRFESALADLFD